MSRERIGIFMDLFDPVHYAHLQIVRCVMKDFKLDCVYMIPAGDFSSQMQANYGDRWKMIVAFCAQDKHMVPLRCEYNGFLEEESTDSVLEFLRREHPYGVFYWILQAESCIKFPDHRLLSEISAMCSFLLCTRNTILTPEISGSVMAELNHLQIKFQLVHVPQEDGFTAIYPEHGLPAKGVYRPILEFCRIKGLYGLPAENTDEEEWITKLFLNLKPHRFLHTLSVAECAARLAGLYGLNQHQAEQAGLLHDCAKCLPLEDMQSIALQNQLTDDPAILSSGALLHAQVGAWIAEHKYGMRDPEVLEAIAYHNTGHARMSRLSMCVCLADSIEPTRDSYPHLEEVRKAAEVSLELALLKSLQGTADFVRTHGKFLHPRTQETISWLKNLDCVRNQKMDCFKEMDTPANPGLFSCWT